MINLRLFRGVASLAVVSLMVISASAFGKPPIYTSLFSNVALSGYDPVAYFSENMPVKGDKRYALEYQDAQWYFKNTENRELFSKSPHKYAPQYGGYCAWAVAQGSTASSDPNIWTIHNGKLYLNYNQGILDKWIFDMEKHIENADKNWPAVL